MSHLEFNNIFSRFKEIYPPAVEYNENITILISTTQLSEMFTELHPSIQLPDLFNHMIFEGYIYFPLQVNGTIRFFWLLDRL